MAYKKPLLSRYLYISGFVNAASPRKYFLMFLFLYLNGFRCALYPDPEKIPEAVFSLVKLGETKDFYKEKPVPDPIFQIYKEQFSYDKTDLNAQVEWKDESHDDWIQ